MNKPQCPKCGSTNYLREKRPDGDTTCRDCGHKAKSSEWDKAAPIVTAMRNVIKKASDKAFHGTIKQQRGHLDENFVNMLESSDFFKSFYNEAFMAGMHFGKKLDKN